MDVPADYAWRLESFRDYILPAESVLVVTHDYPDPDCLAAAAGVSHLLGFWGVPACTTAYGGFVGRAENQAMVRVLDFSAVPLLLVKLENFDRIILVDSVPGGGNVSLPADTPLDAVFDHHLKGAVEDAPYYQDIRAHIGATCTLITQYLRAAQCPIPSRLATALFYGIKTDTGDMGRDNSEEDLSCYKYLFDRIDHKLLAAIERPQRGLDFFQVVARALKSTSLCKNVSHVYLGEVSTPDHIAEMADLFHSLESIDWTVAVGTYNENLFFSIRSKKIDEAGIKASAIAKACGGSGGGHGKIGAGRIYMGTKSKKDLPGKLKKTIKKELGISKTPETPLLKS